MSKYIHTSNKHSNADTKTAIKGREREIVLARFLSSAIASLRASAIFGKHSYVSSARP
jgi:hypothetical protein